MAGIKVHELAKEFGMSSKELMEHLAALGIPAKSHSTSLVEAYVDLIKAQLSDEIAERQAVLAAEEEAKRAEEEKVAAEEADRRKAEAEARKAAEEAERRKREQERAERDAERQRLEAEAQERVAEDAVGTEMPAAPVEEALVEATAADGEVTSSADVDTPATDTDVASAPTDEDTPKKTPSKRPSLADNIEAAAKRLETEAAEKKAARQAQREAARAEKAKRAEEERYRQMAQEAAKLDKGKALADIERAKEQRKDRGGATAQPTKKARKGRGGKAARIEEVEAERTIAEVELPHGGEVLEIPEACTVGQFAELLGVSTNDIIKRLFMLGSMLTVNQPMDNETIELIAVDLEREIVIARLEDEMAFTYEDDEKDLVERSPVVTVMGHVDHGKTSLLDAIRETGVADSEAGGITQHIGASVVEKNGRKITFIDTPGHEAFTAMRARGANITDVVILVVAADDGVMPQTIEAINHAKAAGVPIVVAVNKVDKDTANADTVRQMLTEHGLVPEEWGGTDIFVNVSAKKRTGIDDLLEMLLLQADVLELKGNPHAEAYGTVVEAHLDKGRGPVATVLVRRGTLKVGDTLVAGLAYGRVRALIEPHGTTVETAGPSDPVEVLGLNGVPSAGDDFKVFTDERAARTLADERSMKARLRAHEATRNHVSLDNLFHQIEAGEIKDLNLIVKADVVGSIEALRDALEKMDQSEVRINIIHAAVGGITENDVQLAAASNAVIIGFNVRPTPGAKKMSETESVDMHMYRVIYQAIEDINAARVGMLAPEFVEEDTARIEVRELFKVPKMGVIAGSYVTEGEINRDDQVRIVRDGTVIFEGKIGSLRRFKEDVKSVKAGYECGVGIEGYQDLKEGDVIEGFRINEVARTE
ncbi:MAG: translation initiation factor IF-2 [Coriobacteriia bacterium]|nr:translation initiation factor IF-2 [Coriobacteriia bacterium]